MAFFHAKSVHSNIFIITLNRFQVKHNMYLMCAKSTVLGRVEDLIRVLANFSPLEKIVNDKESVTVAVSIGCYCLTSQLEG